MTLQEASLTLPPRHPLTSLFFPNTPSPLPSPSPLPPRLTNSPKPLTDSCKRGLIYYDEELGGGRACMRVCIR